MTDSYPWLVALGAVASLLWLGFVEPRLEQPKTTLSRISLIDAGLVSLVAGFLGARLAFVLIHWSYFSLHAGEILKYWNGGLNWTGGAIGGLMGLGIYALFRGQSFWSLLDSMAIPAVIIAFNAWFGCLLDGCAYGKQAFYGFLTPLSPDNLGVQLHRWPVQGTGAILTLGSFLLLNKLRTTNLPAGTLGLICITTITTSILLLAFFRGDPVPILNGFRSDAVTSAFLMLLSLLVWALRLRGSDRI